jgi:hypothetical protein
MLPSYRELWYAFTAMIFISVIYMLVVLLVGGIPGASDLFGHSLGILGFILMLMTETLYTVRKRSRSARWGRMSSWLQFHIFTGLVGPFLVLLHSSWKFNGLAGVVMLFTIIIVISGFIGRYIYTAVPRTADGIVIEADVLQAQIREAQRRIDQWMASQPRVSPAMSKYLSAEARQDAGLNWIDRARWWQQKMQMSPSERAQIDELQSLIERRSVLRRQVGRLAWARRLLAVWHSIHVPIGIVLFTSAFIHVGAAIYYATLLR